MHGVVATGSLLLKMKIFCNQLCPFCSECDTIMHIFYECRRLIPLFSILNSFIVNFFPDIKSCPKDWWFCGVPFVYGCYINIKKFLLINWLIVLARKSIYVSRNNKLNGVLPDGVLYIFQSRVKHRLIIEFQYAVYIGEREKFLVNWCLDSLRCYIVNNTLSYHW